MLKEVITEYLLWMRETGYEERTFRRIEGGLKKFLFFARRKKISWECMFTPKTMEYFKSEIGLSTVSAIRGLYRYLVRKKAISESEDKKSRTLPKVYEDYFLYDARINQSSRPVKVCKRRVLCALHDYMDRNKIPLSTMKIEHVDGYFSEYTASFSPRTCHHYRSVLRGFLDYLYREKKILKRDLASLLVSPPVYTQAQPPKFYRKEEIQKLFQSIDTSTSKGLRAYALCILAYTLGLRPKEISLIRLDDILFADGTLILAKRKGANPIKLPLPEQTMKAIVAYIIGGRPKSKERRLFLAFPAPHSPVTSSAVSESINASIGQAHLPGTAYWLRHTYAQNLLESGASIFEIKQMLGHESIQSSKRYIHIHTKLMREVLFDEIL